MTTDKAYQDSLKAFLSDPKFGLSEAQIEAISEAVEVKKISDGKDDTDRVLKIPADKEGAISIKLLNLLKIQKLDLIKILLKSGVKSVGLIEEADFTIILMALTVLVAEFVPHLATKFTADEAKVLAVIGHTERPVVHASHRCSGF